MTEICESCKELKPVAEQDRFGRFYCESCMEKDDASPRPVMEFLAATIPFAVGDRVEARTGGMLFDGIGVVDDIATDIAHFGTPVYPSFHVKIEEKAYPEAPDSLWYTEVCLKKVDA